MLAVVRRDERYLLVRYASANPWRTEPWSLPGADVLLRDRADRALREALWDALGLWAQHVERLGSVNSDSGNRVVFRADVVGGVDPDPNLVVAIRWCTLAEITEHARAGELAGVVLGFGACVVATTAAEVTNLVASLPAYAQQGQALQPRVEAMLAPFGVAQGALGDLQQRAVAELQATGTTVARESLARLAEVFGTVLDLVLVFILSVYLAANGARIAEWLKAETPSGSTRYRAHLLVAVTSRVVGGYIRGVLLLVLLIGVLVGAGLAVLGVPYAVLLGVLAFFMEFVPVLGVFISGAAALIVAIVHFQELLRPLLVLGYFILVHVIEGDVIGPRIMGKAVGWVSGRDGRTAARRA